MRRVATIAGITPMAIYRHFASREALLARVADAGFERVAGQWRDKPQPHDARARLVSQLGGFLDFALSEPMLYDYLFLEQREQGRRFPVDFRAGRSPTLNLVVEALDDGVRQGLFQIEDVWETALVGVAMIQGLIQLYRGGRTGLSETDFRALCNRSIERFLDGLEV
jgi:AcrR family transcriptional regulator